LLQDRTQKFKIQKGAVGPEGGRGLGRAWARVVPVQGQGFFQKPEGPVVGQKARQAFPGLGGIFFKAPKEGTVGLLTGTEIAVEGMVEKPPAGVEKPAPGQKNFQGGASQQKAAALFRGF